MYWIPLESNPEVMNTWSKRAGLDTSLYRFDDVYGLDPDLLAMVPGHTKAVILTFPVTEDIRQLRVKENEKIEKIPVDPNVIWIKQTIGNACGTMAVLHSLMNAGIPISAGSALDEFIKLCKGKEPLERSKLLETTEIFSNIHAEAAVAGQTAAPAANADVDHHYTCFVQAPAQPGFSSGERLIELDGVRGGPVDHGESEDLLKDAASVIKENYMKNPDLQFSILALVEDF